MTILLAWDGATWVYLTDGTLLPVREWADAPTLE